MPSPNKDYCELCGKKIKDDEVKVPYYHAKHKNDQPLMYRHEGCPQV